MPSIVDLCNTALRRIGQEPIIALDTNTIWGRRCLSAWPIVRDEVSRVEVWRCLVKRAEIAANSAAPIGFSKSYQLPSDFVRLAALKLDRYEPWALEGNKILTNREAPLQILYVSRVEDPNEYSTDLFSTFAWRLAVELSGFATTSTVRKDETYAMYLESMSMSININSHENPIDRLEETTWIDARFGNLDRGVLNDGFYGVS